LVNLVFPSDLLRALNAKEEEVEVRGAGRVAEYRKRAMTRI